MKLSFTSIFNQLTQVALLVVLIVSAVQVTPVYAAGIVVNSNADIQANDGVCTLREAIIAANIDARSGTRAGECAAGSSGVDSISFASNYTITIGSQLPFVTTAMTITGKGAANTIIQAADAPNVATWRVFRVTGPTQAEPHSPLGDLTLDGVTVRHGNCYGSTCNAVGGVFPDSGGGILSTGTLTVTNSIISGNRGYAAGGIFSTGTLTVTNSTISGNVAFDGGGIYDVGTLTVTNSTITGNSAVGSDVGGNGGGIYHNINSSPAMVMNSTITGNSANRYGAGIANLSNMTVKDSTISGNSASEGGGISNVGFGFMTITNSTISGNSANGYGAGIANLRNMMVTNSTISGNSANIGGGISISPNPGLHITLQNTIVANNSGGNCERGGGAVIINSGYNLDSGSTCGWGSSNSSLSNTNPLLGALADNGGPTKTMKLLSGSPAIDAGNASICSSSPVNGKDQRGVIRPLGAGCDIGAYETSRSPGPDTVGVFRPSNGLLYLKHLNIAGFADIAINYGTAGDYPVVGDWDGDGDATIGVYRNGNFLLRNSNTKGVADISFPFGQPGDQPVAGDWNNDGVDTIGVYRPSTGQFLLRNQNSSGPPQMSFVLGNPGDVGIAGDWNGDGFDTTGVFRPSNGVIFLKNTNSTGIADISLNYGIPGDKPVTGDWNFDGIDTIGVYRGNAFYLRNSNTKGVADMVFALGNPGDMPIAGNWDGIP